MPTNINETVKVNWMTIHVTVNLMYNGVVIAPKGIELIHDEEALANLVKISTCE